jgi:hypothetical protein
MKNRFFIKTTPSTEAILYIQEKKKGIALPQIQADVPFSPGCRFPPRKM